MSTLREIAHLKCLDEYKHPNIVRLLQVCNGKRLDEEKLLIMFLVFEYLDQDLSSYIDKCRVRGFIGNDKIRNISKEILSGVDFLHSHRIIHRDLKPQNILVNKEGHIKLADFGLAKTYDFEMKLTAVVVTLWYRAPEVLLGLSYATPVDIWSVGCILAELFSLNPIFCGASEADQLCKIFKILGKPSKSEWPSNVSIDYDSFTIVNSVNIKHLLPNLCDSSYDLIMVIFLVVDFINNFNLTLILENVSI